MLSSWAMKLIYTHNILLIFNLENLTYNIQKCTKQAIYCPSIYDSVFTFGIFKLFLSWGIVFGHYTYINHFKYNYMLLWWLYFKGDGQILNTVQPQWYYQATVYIVWLIKPIRLISEGQMAMQFILSINWLFRLKHYNR